MPSPSEDLPNPGMEPGLLCLVASPLPCCSSPVGPRQRQHTLPTLPCPQGPSLAFSNQTSRDEAPAPWDPGLMTVVFGAAPWGPWPCPGLLPACPTAGDLVASASQPCVCLALVCSGDWARVAAASTWPRLQGPFLSRTKLASLIQWT